MPENNVEVVQCPFCKGDVTKFHPNVCPACKNEVRFVRSGNPLGVTGREGGGESTGGRQGPGTMFRPDPGNQAKVSIWNFKGFITPATIRVCWVFAIFGHAIWYVVSVFRSGSTLRQISDGVCIAFGMAEYDIRFGSIVIAIFIGAIVSVLSLITIRNIYELFLVLFSIHDESRAQTRLLKEIAMALKKES